MLASGLSAPNGNGLIGSIANTGAPLLTYQLGQTAKANQAEGSGAHISAYAALTAALGDKVTQSDKDFEILTTPKGTRYFEFEGRKYHADPF